MIAQIEEKLQTKVITYYTAPDANINIEHSDFFFDHLSQIGKQKAISLVLISYGGESSGSLRIASLLREYCDSLQVVIPSRCASAGTMLALAADKILISPLGYLTAIDSSLTHSLNPPGADRRPARVTVDQVKRVLSFLDKEGPSKSEGGISKVLTEHFLNTFIL